MLTAVTAVKDQRSHITLHSLRTAMGVIDPSRGGGDCVSSVCSLTY